MGPFNNREIAVAFWSILVVGWAFSLKKIRPSILQLAKNFFSPKIIIPFTFLSAYSFLIVLLLREIRIWSLSNLKETIYWFIFSGTIIAFKTVIDRKTEKPIRKQIKDLVTFTVILEFIVNTYVFDLLIELFFVPMITVMTAIYTYASIKSQYKKVEKFLGVLLAIIGITMFIQASVQIYHNFDKFRRFDTLIDFVLPPILTISILPAIYLLMLYASYELLFARINLTFGHSNEKRWYAKKLLIFHCGFRLGKVRDMLRRRVDLLYDIASKEDIRRILLNEKMFGAE